MVEIRPFRAYRYNTEKFGEDLSNLITQPYDKIDAKMQEEYYRRHEYNYVKLILPKEENRYEIAAKRLKEWKEKGVFVRDKEPAIYLYVQRFSILGKEYERRGIIAAMRLHPFEEKIVLPHEKTHKGPKEDRLRMLRATKTNLEPGFVLYSDPEGKVRSIMDKIMKEKPFAYGKDDYGVENYLWAITDKDDIAAIKEVIDPQQVVIADGHHRYETAVYFRDEMRKAVGNYSEDHAFNFRMTAMVSIEDPGLVILPTHRLLLKEKLSEEHFKEIKKYFDVDGICCSKMAKEFLEENKDRHAFVIYQDGKYYGLVLKDSADISEFMKEEWSEDYRNLDAVILHSVIFSGIMNLGDLRIDEDIAYERWIEDAVAKVDSGEAKMAVLMNPTKASQVLAVARNGERMPQKTTDFYPKMLSGFTMMPIGPEELLRYD